ALPVIAGTAAVAMLAVFATITFVQAQRIARERDVADMQRTRAEQVSQFLVELFELSDPSKSRGHQSTARELLDVGARRANVGLADPPETRATLLPTIGNVYSSLGLYSEAVALLENALASKRAVYGPKHPEVADAMNALAGTLLEQNEFERVERLLQDALQMQREIAGEGALENAPILLTYARLEQHRGRFDDAERLYERSLAIYRAHGQEHTTAAALL